MLKSVEAGGKTLDAAIEKGMNDLGVTSKSQVEIKILKDNGFLFNKYKVLVTKKLTEGELATQFLENLLSYMHFDFMVETVETEESINIDLIGTDSASIIGYRGEVLDSIQYLTGLVCNRNKDSYKRLTIDTENYREKRAETLRTLARNLESKVKRTGRIVKLEPMNPYERRIIHSALQDSEIVTTVSEGVNPNRYVTIVPKHPFDGKSKITNSRPQKSQQHNKEKKNDNYSTSHIQEASNTVESNETEATSINKKPSMNFVYSSEKKRRRNPLSK